MSSDQITILNVTGMSCGSCVRHVSEALRKVAGVTRADVDLPSGKVTVAHDNARASIDVLIASVEQAGYEASLAS